MKHLSKPVAIAGGTDAVSCSAIIILEKKLLDSYPFLPCNRGKKNKADLTTVLRVPASGSRETSSGIGSSTIISD